MHSMTEDAIMQCLVRFFPSTKQSCEQKPAETIAKRLLRLGTALRREQRQQRQLQYRTGLGGAGKYEYRLTDKDARR